MGLGNGSVISVSRESCTSLYYKCTGMIFLYSDKLLVNQTKHAVDLAIKQNLDLLAC